MTIGADWDKDIENNGRAIAVEDILNEFRDRDEHYGEMYPINAVKTLKNGRTKEVEATLDVFFDIERVNGKERATKIAVEWCVSGTWGNTIAEGSVRVRGQLGDTAAIDEAAAEAAAECADWLNSHGYLLM